MDPTSPGLFVPFSGDPDTTEEGCLNNEREETGLLSDCGSWDFAPVEYGAFGSFQQDDWRIAASNTSDNGKAQCSKLSGFCNIPVMRYVTTFKNTLPPNPGTSDGHPMATDRDWVFSVDYSNTIDPEDSSGGADIFQLHVASEITEPTALLLFDIPGQPGTVRLWTVGKPVLTFQRPLMVEDVNITVHYKADVEKMDFYWDGERLAEDIVLAEGDPNFDYLTNDLHYVQMGSSSPSGVISQSFDNMIVGVVGAQSNMPGDANGDGVVDVADLGVLGANFNQSNMTFADGDFNDDGIVDVADLGILGANWSASQATGNTSALVPEPTTLSLLAMSVLVVGRRRC